MGYKISPLLWAKVKKGLSAGRVQRATRLWWSEQEIGRRSFRKNTGMRNARFQALNAKEKDDSARPG